MGEIPYKGSRICLIRFAPTAPDAKRAISIAGARRGRGRGRVVALSGAAAPGAEGGRGEDCTAGCAAAGLRRATLGYAELPGRLRTK